VKCRSQTNPAIPFHLYKAITLHAIHNLRHLSSFVSSTPLIPEVAVDYRVEQNKRICGSPFKLIVQQKF